MLGLAVDLDLLPDADRVVHIDQTVGVGHHGLVRGMVHLKVLSGLHAAVFKGVLCIRSDGADEDVVLLLDVGDVVPDVPDIDHVVERDLAVFERLDSLLQRLIRAGNGLGTVVLVLDQLASGAEIALEVRAFRIVPDVLDPDGLLGRQLAAVKQRQHLVDGIERIDVIALIGQVVGAEDHILRRDRDGLAVLRAQQVVGRQHQHTGLSLCLCRQRNVNCHLVAVKVGVERGAAQRMQLQRAALDQNRLKRLNAETPLSIIFLADLMLFARPSSTSFFITNGRNSSMAISFGTPH